MASVKITNPTTPLITLDDLKPHCHIDESAEDATIQGYINAALAYCERYSNSQFINCTWKRLVERWPSNGVLKIHRGPLVEVDSVEYVDADGATQPWDDANYQVVTLVSPGQLGYLYARSCPPHRSQPQAIIVTYTAGYGESPDDVPPQAIQAASMLAAHWYENREATGSIGGEIAFSVHALLDQISFASFSEDN